MSYNNDLVFDGALAGCMAALTASRNAAGQTASDYAAAKNVAVAIATEVDALIPTLNCPTVDGIMLLISQICYGALTGRGAASVTPADYAVLAGQIKGMFLAAGAAFTPTAIVPASP